MSPGRTDPSASHPARPRPTAPPCAAPTRPARGMSGLDSKDSFNRALEDSYRAVVFDALEGKYYGATSGPMAIFDLKLEDRGTFFDDRGFFEDGRGVLRITSIYEDSPIFESRKNPASSIFRPRKPKTLYCRSSESKNEKPHIQSSIFDPE